MKLQLNDLKTIRAYRHAALKRDRELRDLEARAMSPEGLERLAFDLQRLDLPRIAVVEFEVETITVRDIAGLERLVKAAGGAA